MSLVLTVRHTVVYYYSAQHCQCVVCVVASSMKDLFENVASQNIVDFIKETLFISNFNVCVLMFVTGFFFILAKEPWFYILYTFYRIVSYLISSQ